MGQLQQEQQNKFFGLFVNQKQMAPDQQQFNNQRKSFNPNAANFEQTGKLGATYTHDQLSHTTAAKNVRIKSNKNTQPYI